jgi:streptogramin lyase
MRRTLILVVVALAVAGCVVVGRTARAGAQPPLRLAHRYQRYSGENSFVIGFESLWVGGSNNGQSVTRVDLATGKTRTIAASATANDSIDVGPTAVWYSDFDNGALRRIDPTKNKVTHVTTGLAGASDAVFVGGHVWELLHHAQSVAEIDGRTGRVVARLRLPSADGGTLASGPTQGAYAYGSLWVAVPNKNSIYRIDPSRHTVTAAINADSSTGGPLVAAGGSLWAVCGKLLAIDPATNRVTLRIPITAAGLTALGGELWATTAKGAIEEIDPKSGAALSKTQPRGTFFTDVTAAGGELWAWDANNVQVDEFRTN